MANTEVTFTLSEDVRVNFTLGDGDRMVTDTDGKTKVTPRGTKAGVRTATVSMAGGRSKQLMVNFTVDTLTAQVDLNATKDNFVANNIGMIRLQAIMIDGNGDSVEGIKVNFRGTSVMLSSTSIGTDDQVFAEILATSTEAGLKTVSASLADEPTEVISRLLNAKTDVSSATITSQEMPEGQVMVAQDIAVKVHVGGRFGNPVTHQSMTFNAAPSPQMIISQSTVSINTQGVAEVTMTSERDGSYTVKASLVNGALLEEQLEAIDEKLTLMFSPLIDVNAPKGATLMATLAFANGTPVEDQVINFSVTLESATSSGEKVRINSLGQAPVVLTSNKAGIYTVTASFHNGITIQAQITTKVTGNPSAVYIVSLIADPSAVAATNSDLSTLETTVGDGSGNPIEGSIVHFVLKSGSTALTSLTAVTDQNRIATTSVRGEITGSVTVSIVTSAGEM